MPCHVTVSNKEERRFALKSEIMTSEPPTLASVRFLCARCCRPGTEKARVLPEPVSAIPMASLPPATRGQHTLWIGVGLSKSAHTFMHLSSRLASANSSTGLTPPPSVTLMECFS